MLVLIPNGTPSATPRLQLDRGNDDDDSHSDPQKYVESGKPEADRRNRSISSFQLWKENNFFISIADIRAQHLRQWHAKLD